MNMIFYAIISGERSVRELGPAYNFNFIEKVNNVGARFKSHAVERAILDQYISSNESYRSIDVRNQWRISPLAITKWLYSEDEGSSNG